MSEWTRDTARPLQDFLRTEAGSASLLLAATIVALVWANSPFADAYEDLWATEATVSVGAANITEDLRHWVNDGLMVLFFLVVGLEIRRELAMGELTDRRRAAIPAAAALAGMVVPAALYLTLNLGGEGARGWGIVMATDIAFVLGLLALLGPNAPRACGSSCSRSRSSTTSARSSSSPPSTPTTSTSWRSGSPPRSCRSSWSSTA
jgi:Na+/H+ antiporter NhaA